MAEGSRVQLSYIKEVSYGVTPAGQFTALSFQSETFNLNKTKDKKKKVLPTREYAGLTSKTEMTEGGFENPLEALTFDELFEGVLMASWVGILGNGSGVDKISAGLAASNLELTFTTEVGAGVGGTIVFGSAYALDIVKDQWLFVVGTPNSGENDGAYIVKSIAGNTVTVNNPLVTATYEATCDISGDRLRNGSQLVSYSFERSHLDIGAYFVYSGEVLGSLEVKFESEEDVMLTFDYMGKSESEDTNMTSSPAPAALVDQPYFVTGDNVEGVFIDYVALSDCAVQDLTFKIDNQVESRKSIAVFGPCAQRIKPIDVSGSITMFFENLTNYSKYPLDTEFQLALAIGDSNNIKYGFTLASVEFTTGKTNVDDAENEVPEEHDFMATTDGSFTVQICKSIA